MVGYFNVIKTGKKNVTVIVPHNSPYNEKREPGKTVFSQAKQLVDSLEESMATYNKINSPYRELYLVLMTDGYPHAGFFTGNFIMLNNAILGSRWLKFSSTRLNKLDKKAAGEAFKALQTELSGNTPWKPILIPNLSSYRARFFELYRKKKK